MAGLSNESQGDAYGNENWEFDNFGYMKFRYATINDQPIAETERKFRWGAEAIVHLTEQYGRRQVESDDCPTIRARRHG